jgi:CO/xanthine dehydrogenase Mo-binding subunit/aerobic-type carbon monoxide dehydrogenase small subunit (CoxS/CutS family)
MNEPVEIQFDVNGRTIRDRVDGSRSLLDYLRDTLRLTGAKQGCGKAQCGACTVLVNDRPVKACATKLGSERLAGARIETIEGLSADGAGLHPIQEAFIRAGALQCGYCTPGMIMSVKGLLAKNPSPGRQDIRKFLAPRNLCRCTGYQKIIDAVQDAGRVMRGKASRLPAAANDAPLRKQEAVPKVTGRLRYADDIVWENMLFGKVLFSAEPHARLIGLDTAAAEKIPGVAGVITAEDIPGAAKIGMIVRDQPALVAVGETVRSIADPIAAVFAESSSAAERALDAIKVDYRPLAGVFDETEAAVDGATVVHPDKPGNRFFHGCLERGDVQPAFEQADAAVSGEFSTSRIAHGYMEPESGLARPDGSGGVEIHYPTQSVFDDRAQVAEVLALPPEKVRVIQLPTGGAFGGKEDVIFHHLLALAALKFGRPVKITLTREESLRVSQKKHGMRFKARLALNRDGTFEALDVRISTDKGAYASLGFDIIENAMAFVGGPYFIPCVRIEGRSYYTHNVMAGAMRGFGANQGNFVIESLVDMAAARLKMDPFDIRLKNALRPGLPTVTDHVLEPGVPGVVETLQTAKTAFLQQNAPGKKGGTRLGVGIACGVKNVGFGHGLPESAGARVELKPDGSCHLRVTHHEYGQGAVIGQARIAAETLGIPIENIAVAVPDTGKTPFTGASTASRQTFLSGNATLGACRRLLSDLFELAASKLDVQDPALLHIDGDAIAVKGSERRLPLSSLGERFSAEFRTFPPETRGFRENGEKSRYGDTDFASRRTHWAYAYGAQIAWVQVEEKTGKVRVLKVLTVGDVGRVLNRRAVEGQQEGGVVMGVGYALTEQFESELGKSITKTLRQCGIPTALEAPDIVTVAVEVPHPWGPLGLKGLAEAPSLATAPAVANAIHDAVGVRLKHLPMTPERVKTALHKEKSMA